MPTRNVVLSEHQHDLVEALVKSGRYQNASEVLREGLRLIEQRERLEAARLEALKEAADRGWAAIAAGDCTDVAEDQIEGFIDQLSEQAARLAHTAD
jgi:antitoxin ParD1/3/4